MKHIYKVMYLILCLAIIHPTNRAHAADTTESQDQVSITENIQYKTNLNVLDILKQLFPKFYQLTQRAGIASNIEGSPNITIFAPTDKALDDLRKFLGNKTYDAYTGAGTTDNPDHLIKLVQMHIVPTRLLADEIMHLESIRPLSGRRLHIHTDNGILKINGSAKAERFDILGTNGVVHTIDAVLMP